MSAGELKGSHDRSRRRAELQASLDSKGIDLLVVTNPANIRYLSGFAGSTSMLLVGAETTTLLTDARYGEQARSLADEQQALDAFVDGRDEQADLLKQAALLSKRVGLEATHVSWAQRNEWAEAWGGDIELVPTSGEVEAIRLIKEPHEVELIERAASITDEALTHVAPMLATGLTELAFKRALDAAILERGADDLSFDTIVASGPNAARPHHSAADRQIVEGDLVVIDVGALVDGYHSDMTRTFHVGDMSDLASEVYSVVIEGQQAGVEAVKPGATGRDVDAAARSVIRKAGFGDEFVHGVGHGVGLDIHEAPLMAGSDVALVPGQVVTVEPGVYRSGFGGVRIEDTVVVTDNGCRRLTAAPKDPIVV